MSRILFVVHRGAPYPGGSETYTHNMAVEAKSRGHSPVVLAQTHQGNYEGIEYTNNLNVLTEYWGLIVVHGCDTNSFQDIVLQNVKLIKAPVLYLIIKPSVSATAGHGLIYADYLGYSTSMDLDHIKKCGVGISRARRVRHGIPLSTIKPKRTIPARLKTILSVGGFYPHKGMHELVETFKSANLKGTQLVLCGYGAIENAPKTDPRNKVYVYTDATHEQVLQEIALANLYVMNSTEEGFGLVLLEAMINKTPWFARDIAGAHDLKAYGTTYDNQNLLAAALQIFFKEERIPMHQLWQERVENACQFVMQNHTIKQTIDDIEDIVNER